MIFICDIKIDIIMGEAYCVKVFLGGLSLHFNHLIV